MSNLRLINETTTTAGVRLINITDVFSDDFQIYKIVGANMLGNNSTASGNNLRFISNSGSIIVAGYKYAQQVLKAEEVRDFIYNSWLETGDDSLLEYI